MVTQEDDQRRRRRKKRKKSGGSQLVQLYSLTMRKSTPPFSKILPLVYMTTVPGATGNNFLKIDYKLEEKKFKRVKVMLPSTRSGNRQ